MLTGRLFGTVTGNYSLIICVCVCVRLLASNGIKVSSTEHLIYAVRPQAPNPLFLTQLVSSSKDL